jgi:hypothetical protein
VLSILVLLVLQKLSEFSFACTDFNG